ncbi:MAG: hypothetical protein QNJ57_01335 [Flavobacteriaceae bacterium]|nr:hypothetical protein [Flavobacteriaceae bacterium]
MKSDHLTKGRNYEILIRRAHNCEKGRKYGADSELYYELVQLELQNIDSVRYLWRFEKLKKYIAGALFKLRKRKRYLGSENEFSPILDKLNNAKNANDLAKIASLGLAKIIECENRLRESG